MNEFPSKLLEEAVNEFSRLPGIGRRTALRLVLHLLKQDKEEVNSFGNAIIRLRNEINFCRTCNNICDDHECSICSSVSRDRTTICVVESIRDVMAIEKTHQFNGLYHVLGGIISPVDGIGPGDLAIESLEKRVSEGTVSEIIMALSTTMEGDTTNFYIFKRLSDYNVRISVLARGVAVGDELSYADEITLGRSIVNRTPFDAVVSR